MLAGGHNDHTKIYVIYSADFTKRLRDRCAMILLSDKRDEINKCTAFQDLYYENKALAYSQLFYGAS